MKAVLSKLVAPLFGACLFTFYATAAAWVITDLGMLPGSTGCRAEGINNPGQVVGHCSTDEGGRAFLWSRDTGMISLGTLPERPHSAATDINDAGQIVGLASFNGGNNPLAFFWSNATGMQKLGTLANAHAQGINQAGKVAGWDNGGAFVWSSEYGKVQLARPPRHSPVAYDINDNDQVAGFSTLPPETIHAVLWPDPATMQDLGALPDWRWSLAYGLNNNADVVGCLLVPTTKAFIWSNESGVQTFAALPGESFSCAYDVNDSRRAVGEASTDAAGQRAVLWANGEITDLATLPEVEAAGWQTLLVARAINNVGQVVGYGTRANAGDSAFLLSPEGNEDSPKSLGPCPPAGQGPGEDPNRPDRCDPGNPINPATGNKYQIEIDYVGAGIHPLRFERYYNSASRAGGTSIGRQWRHRYERSVVRNGATATVFRSDGKQYVFRQDPANWVGDPDVMDRLYQHPDGWTYVTAPESDVEGYDAAGRLTSIASRSGIAHVISYDESGQIARITHSASGAALVFAYDPSNRVAAITDPGGKLIRFSYQGENLSTVTYPDDTPSSSDDPVRTYLYNEPQHTSGANLPHHLTGIVDEKNIRLSTYRYDAKGRGVSTEHAGGAGKYRLTYNFDGSTAITDPLLTTRVYNFQTVHGVPRDVIVDHPCDGCGVAMETEYAGNGALLTATNFNRILAYYIHDARSLEAMRYEAMSTNVQRVTSTVWHQIFRLPTRIAEPKRITSISYDDKGNLTAYSIQPTGDASGGQGFNAIPVGAPRTWSFSNTYSSSLPGVMVQQVVDGPRTDAADISAYRWNDAGNLISTTNALGHVTTLADYDAHGRPRRVTDPNGLVNTLTYDARGRLTSRTSGAELSTFSYDPVGQLTKLTLPDASFLKYTYDAAHRLIQIADNPGNKIVYTLDAMGNRTKEEVFDPSGVLARKRSSEYNALNRLIKDIGGADPVAEITEYGYDSQGNLTSVTDPLNRTTSNGYDALNRLVSVIDPAPSAPGPGASTQYGYDGLDQLIQVTDPKGLTTAYTVDGLGNLAQQFSPDTGITGRTYDAAGNVKTSTDARGQTTTYSYDALNRVTLVDYASGTDTRFEYDGGPGGALNAKGRLTRMTDASGSTTWTYDSMGRVIRKSQTVGNITRAVNYAYDPSSGKLTSIAYPSPNYGRAVGFTYAANGRVSSISVNGITHISNITYTPFGLPKTWVWAGGRSYVRTYDLNGRLKTYQAQHGTRSLSYDVAGRITGISDSLTPSINSSFGYDNLDRLTSYAGFPGSRAYTYDANGNRTSATVGANTYPYVVDPSSNRLLSAGGSQPKTFTYDAAGNITSDGSATFSYNSRGRLASTQNRVGTTTYLINGLGQRVKKQGPNLGGQAGEGTYHFLYDEEGKLLGVYSNSGIPFHEYVYLDGLPVLDIVVNHPQTQPTAVYYVIPDQTGTPRMMINGTNGIVWRWDAAPFGDSPPNPPSNSSMWSHMRFPGQFFDPQTGLHYNYFRDYDPETGRYIEPDPIGLSGGTNPYAYVANSPISSADPVGLQGTRRVVRVTPAEAFEGQYGTGLTAELLFREIQRIDGGFRYPATVGRPNSAAGAGDVFYLQRVLEGYQMLKPRVYSHCSSTDPIGGNYLLRDPLSDSILYAGRTNDLARREYEYSRSALQDLIFQAVARTDSYSQQRGVEQLLYQRYSPELNRINPISPISPRLEFYLDTAQPLTR